MPRYVDRSWESGYIYHASFDDPKQVEEFMAVQPHNLVQGVHVDARPVKTSPTNGTDCLIYSYGLLTREGERVLFLRMNYAKYKASISRRWRPRWLKHAYDTRNVIATHNLRLVVHVTRNPSGDPYDLLDKVSKHNLVLLRAIDKFDLSKLNQRGESNKFSTYATWAITNEQNRNYARSQLYPERVAFGLVVEDDYTPDPDSLIDDDPNDLGDPLQKLRAALPMLGDERQIAILSRSFGLDGASPQTLKEIGRALGMPREQACRLRRCALRSLKQTMTSLS